MPTQAAISKPGTVSAIAGTSEQAFDALGLADAERVELAAAHVLDRGRDVVVHQLDLAAEHGGGRRSDAAIGHVGELDAGLDGEQLEPHVAEVADAAGREVQRAGLSPSRP